MINKKCRYYPCHKKLEDCTFCYCPFYPCRIKKLGKFKDKIWDCSNCEFIHKKEIIKYLI